MIKINYRCVRRTQEAIRLIHLTALHYRERIPKNDNTNMYYIM